MIPTVLGAQATGVCVPFSAITRKDVAWAGGKAANLGEMVRAGIPVPPGFVITTTAYRAYMTEHEIDPLVTEQLGRIGSTTNGALSKASTRIQEKMLAGRLSSTIGSEIVDAYKALGGGPVAVRSSATAEDLEHASFAGQQDTYLNVVGVADLISAVRSCWASLFEARATYYREENGIEHSQVSMAVAVQRMVPSDVSGVMFTVDPSANDSGDLLIEAIFGLGEPLVSGQLSPDAYTVSRDTLSIVDRTVATQPWMLKQKNALEGGSDEMPVPPAVRSWQKLGGRQIVELAAQGLRLERHFGQPQDVEWAFVDEALYVLQSRPITVPASGPAMNSDHPPELNPVASGAGASPGVAFGMVRVIASASEIDHVQDGDILVTEMTTPDFVPAMKRAAAIVSREMGLPCIVGTGDATNVLRNFLFATVDGSSGAVYEGDVSESLTPAEVEPSPDVHLDTRTKLYVNLADPDAAERVAALDVDGVGLLRAEFMIAHLGEHPRAMLESGRGVAFTQHLARGLERFASAFHPKPIVYRFSDFKTNEYRNLKGGEDYEPFEENPMIGYRGCARYLAEPDLFALEVEALMQVRQRFPNVWGMLPFVRSVPELEDVKSLLLSMGLEQGPEFKLWMMVELPTNVLLLDEFLDAGIDGVSIGSNDLTQLILGVDRDNEQLAAMFDERDPAVLKAIEKVVRTCKARDVSVSICGQAPSVYPDLTRSLVEWGVTSVSVSPDMIGQTRTILHQAEMSPVLAY
ncbi:MAG TPA: phosphoenolpyruvate synthase [Dehalococcoidia bacterium]|jgi:pyruvate,water dikinase|nr:phosphoenolpyruvate synthase [Dehalococcoidia bacterium]|tara:strand:+ start:1109 stop:3349 length:2241 start_codon:yes stop_codon:yes gene_type:complete